MANVKISALPVASNVASTDTFPFVQGAVTKQVTRDVLMELVSAGAGTASLPSYTFAGDANTGMWRPAANTLAWSVNGSESMRLDASGNLGIGTSSPVEKLHVDQGNFYAIRTGGAKLRLLDQNNEVSVESSPVGVSSDMVFRTSAQTRMTLDASGDLFCQGVYNNTSGSAANVFVANNGLLQRSTSSLKYKTDIQDATHGLADVMRLRPVTYKGKNDGDKVFGGLIAEEVHSVGLTEFVQYADDGSPDALAYGNMVSLLIKAIQEQQELIKDLRARVAALELK